SLKRRLPALVGPEIGLRLMKNSYLLLVCALALAMSPDRAAAHPVPKDHHDRTIVVHFKGEDARVIVRVDYRLEVDELTVFLEDMKPYRDEVPKELFVEDKHKFYDGFTRIYAPIFARNLTMTIGDDALTFTCLERTHRLTDEKGESLGHLRCDFVFQ